MELFEHQQYFILRNGEYSLWCNRENGSITPKKGWGIDHHGSRCCLGKVYGVIGKLRITPDGDWRLLLIGQQRKVGTLPGCNKPVYVITKIVLLPLSLQTVSIKELEVEPCSIHHPADYNQSQTTTDKQSTGPQKSLQKTWNQLKSAAENMKPKKLPFRLLPNVGDSSGTNSAQSNQKDLKEKEKFERRVIEELSKMFNSSESFYYCTDGDLTNSVQRQHADKMADSDKMADANSNKITADDRFFWNKHMMQDILTSDMELSGPWLIPIIQGYVQIDECPVTFEDEEPDLSGPSNGVDRDVSPIMFKLCLVSRRSRYRAGTRYKRRGIDEEGHTANYVETEQIVQFANHIVSFVQVRGSVPLYWSQTGIKYKPPPRIERDEPANRKAFQEHFKQELDVYSSVAVVSLVDQLGKEKVISDAFLSHILTYNHSDLTYITFDFHEYCRGMQFENVNILTENIMDIIQNMHYCWVDDNGTICEQRGVFRVNCIDCLDRTNIVQSAIARIVLEIQCRKLGLLSPERRLAASCRTIYQQMWANNGDTLSRQYAGTAALKGDYTRTGERRFAGMMKDGVNSANRYYINRVKDVFRQATIDLMLGNTASEELNQLRSNRLEGSSPGAGVDEEDGQVLVEKEENLRTLIDECKKMLMTSPEECLGGWGLIDCDTETGDPDQQDMDIILLLSQNAYYVARYDDETDQVTNYQRVLLDDLTRIEIGVASTSNKHRHPMCIRVYYRRPVPPDGSNSGGVEYSDGYFHTFCTTGTRLFNNIVISIRTVDEARESLRAIAETFVAAKKLLNQDVVITDTKLDKKSSRSPPAADVIDIACQAQQRVEATIPPPVVSRVSSFTNLTQLAPEATRHAIELVLDTTAHSSQKLLEISRSVVGLPWRSRTGGASTGSVSHGVRHRPAGVVYYNATASSTEHLGIESEPAHDITPDLLRTELHDGKIAKNEETKSEVVNIAGKNLSPVIADKLHSDSDEPICFDVSNDKNVQHNAAEADLINFISSNDVRSNVVDDSVSHSQLPLSSAVDSEFIQQNGRNISDINESNCLSNDKYTAELLEPAAAAATPTIVLDESEGRSPPPPPLCRRHSLLKLSHSEGSLSTSAAGLSVVPIPLEVSSADDLSTVLDEDFELLDLELGTGAVQGGTSGLARLLKGKMAAALAVPRGGSNAGVTSLAETNHQQLEELAKRRLVKSNLRFKQCRTRILLL